MRTTSQDLMNSFQQSSHHKTHPKQKPVAWASKTIERLCYHKILFDFFFGGGILMDFRPTHMQNTGSFWTPLISRIYSTQLTFAVFLDP